MDEMLQSPSIDVLEQELHRLQAKKRRNCRIGGFFCILATLIAVMILVCALWTPVVQVYGSDMAPSLQPGDMLIAVPAAKYAPGDIVAFYHNNTIHVRRIIAGPGSLIEILPDGTVCVDGKALVESYVTEIGTGQCDMEFPCRVPDGCVFVLGDNRTTAIDSRSSVIGFVGMDRIAGKVFLKIWPWNAFTFSGNNG